ncbi:hypothetical protein [Hainan oligodon formosanus arterivirus]|uniref:Uncharacterized protein n=1 Tax=Hainan oligodon formosanus arterivirus TaxID=2116440 RepID=A0A2P1GMX7_9NIDO|nr:hypothetical protein [Hainan oligodon formosanus arterivirus]AVM87320.1 hypothetical protein [Hainan oligodon formosanus arterivirus]
MNPLLLLLPVSLVLANSDMYTPKCVCMATAYENDLGWFPKPDSDPAACFPISDYQTMVVWPNGMVKCVYNKLLESHINCTMVTFGKMGLD